MAVDRRRKFESSGRMQKRGETARVSMRITEQGPSPG